MTIEVKTPAQIMRELMDYYSDAPADQVLFTNRPKSKRQTLKEQSQDSLQAQLQELHTLANKNGLYDAADFIKKYAYR